MKKLTKLFRAIKALFVSPRLGWCEYRGVTIELADKCTKTTDRGWLDKPDARKCYYCMTCGFGNKEKLREARGNHGTLDA